MKTFPVLNQSPCHEDVFENGSKAPRILNLGTIWRWVVSFTPWSVYSQGRDPRIHCIGDWLGPRAGLEICMYTDPEYIIPLREGWTQPPHYAFILCFLGNGYTLPLPPSRSKHSPQHPTKNGTVGMPFSYHICNWSWTVRIYRDTGCQNKQAISRTG
jgi:hypothetical protein